jgi:hypothetical protein
LSSTDWRDCCDEKGRIWKEVALSHRFYYTIIFLEGLRKTTNKLRIFGIQADCSIQDLKQ